MGNVLAPGANAGKQSIDAPHRARFLVEALPYILAFRGKTFVIRYDGHARTHRSIRDGFGRDVALLQLAGINPVVVHEGGAYLNQEIVGLVNRHGGKAVGLGAQAGHADPTIISLLQSKGFMPVLIPIVPATGGETCSLIADIFAGAVAETLKAEKLVLMTSTPGILDKGGTLFSALTTAEIERLFADGTIHCGWPPKLKAALQAVRHGVKSAHVINGRVPGALLLEILTSEGLGTMIRADDGPQLLPDTRRHLAA